MKLSHEVHPVKLRGGYYTDAPLVDWCIERATQLTQLTPRRWLEPSAGDGAFIRGLARLQSRLSCSEIHVDAIEVIAEEAQACRRVLSDSAPQGLRGCIANESFFAWAKHRQPTFDAVVGNPPYVRYQFVNAKDRQAAQSLAARLGVELRGVSNLWIPFTLVSLSLLRPRGAFALVLPSELFCTVSGGQFRSTVIRDFSCLRVDLFPRHTFPTILQDVVVVSGRRADRQATARTVTFCEHGRMDDSRWQHEIDFSQDSWQRYLLAPNEIAVFKAACKLPNVFPLGGIARVGVSIVTGANPFFTVDDPTVAEYALEPWARALLARTADAPGFVFRPDDHAAARARGSRAWLLDFSADRPDPTSCNRVLDYLAKGEAQGLHERYKCRIRSPWYRVPQIKAGRLMMPKRAHQHHRLLLNQANVVTTDTVYRGEMLELFADREEDFVSGFQNTLTLLSAEIEGRTYGGGVLELVPSEIARLQVPLARTSTRLGELDALSRVSGGQRDATATVIEATDLALSEQMPDYADLLPVLRRARCRLVGRRLNVPFPSLG